MAPSAIPGLRRLTLAAAALALAACATGGGSSAATPSASPTPAPAASPSVPPAVPVSLDKASTALLMLDMTSVVCTPRKSCAASVPAVAALMKKARDAGVANVYSDTPTAGSAIRDELAPRPGDPKVTARADKFNGTDLDQILKQKGIKTLVVTGTAANGAVLYTSFEANLRGYTVVVAEDGISSDDPFALLLTRYQLINQPGMANPQNKPLQAGAVTLSRSDLIDFK